ncbi:Transposase, IS605 OrfB [Methanocaldococcus bathoardescens]|uniref:Transposase, IS605 OrfB n=2 Tax=Methanocaldococcus bathoardescens TaxID=1301915 RepID=A0A076L9S6_9EURY|nr:Transposase, IS605 OrfB [Methanocaldococcus bathoardescens]
MPKPPKVKKLKNIDKFTFELNKKSFEVNNNYLILKLRYNSKTKKWKKIKIKLPPYVKNITSVRITYYLGLFYVDIVNEVYIEELKPIGNYKAGIDLNVNNFVVLTSTNPLLKSLIISGGELKAFNQWWNKLKSKIQSKIDLTKNHIEKLKSERKEVPKKLYLKLKSLIRRFRLLCIHRKQWFDNHLHRFTKYLALFLFITGHDKVFVSNNILRAKNRCNLSSKANERFVYLPFRVFIDKLAYKLKWFGIVLIEVDESWTSKSSCISDDIHKIQNLVDKVRNKLSLCGERIKRGLLLVKKLNKVFNADVNASYNILKIGCRIKDLSKLFNQKLLMKKLCNPIKVRVFKFIEILQSVIPESPVVRAGDRVIVKSLLCGGNGFIPECFIIQ